MNRLFGSGLLAIAVMAQALCSSAYARTDEAAERASAAAALASLRAQESALNTAFTGARAKLSGEDRKDLLDEQRRWVRARNLECGLEPKEASDSQWPANLSTDKADCVLRAAKARTQILAGRQDIAGRLDSFADTGRMAHVEEFTLPVGRNSGKWYAEVTIERGIAETAEKAGFQIGIDNASGFYALGLGKVKLPPDQPVEVVGLMVDLDRRTLNWRTVTLPFSDDAIPLAVGTRPYAIKVKGARNLEYWLARGQVKINYGQNAFKYTMPAGYSPWYYSRDEEDPIRWLVPSYERTGNLEVKQTASAFWNWLLDRDSADNPTLDRDGGLCEARQKGQFWFLAGAEASARIERTCTVPFGTNVVIPVTSAMLTSNSDDLCTATAEVARLSPHTIQDSFLEIDGRRFDRLQDYSASEFSCAPLTVAGQQLAKQANWLGLWVTLRPLPRGEHTIAFGGRVKAINADRKVTYKVLVK